MGRQRAQEKFQERLLHEQARTACTKIMLRVQHWLDFMVQTCSFGHSHSLSRPEEANAAHREVKVYIKQLQELLRCMMQGKEHVSACMPCVQSAASAVETQWRVVRMVQMKGCRGQ